MSLSLTRTLLLSLIGITIAADAAAEDLSRNGYHGPWGPRVQRVQESVEVSDHTVFNTTDRVDGATVLVRDFNNRVVTGTLSTRALNPESAYSIWAAVFNRPEFCMQPYQCGLKDLNADPRVKPSVFWAGGFVSDAFGTANTSFRIVPGKTKRELFGPTRFDFGLKNLHGAEIHIVLRDHGLIGLAGPVSQQVGTAMEACPADGCKNVFASIHLPEKFR